LSASTPSLEHKQVILAIDGLQPDMGDEVLWVIRECQSGELLARTLLSLPSRFGRTAQTGQASAPVTNCWGNVMDSNQFVKQSKPHCQKSLTLCVIFTICAKQQFTRQTVTLKKLAYGNVP